MAIACGKAQAFDSDLLEANHKQNGGHFPSRKLGRTCGCQGMVPLIADRVQEFRPRELVHIADAYASQSHLALHTSEQLQVKVDSTEARMPVLGQDVVSNGTLKHQDISGSCDTGTGAKSRAFRACAGLKVLSVSCGSSSSSSSQLYSLLILLCMSTISVCAVGVIVRLVCWK